MRKHFLNFVATSCLILSCPLNAMTNHLITTNSAGDIKLQSTIKSAETYLKSSTFSSTTDGEGVPLISVTNKQRLLFLFYLNNHDMIQFIEIFDNQYQTKDGVRTGMSIHEIEKHYGKLTEIIRSEIESREYATFTNQPKDIIFRVTGKNDGEAGIYSNKDNKTQTYHSDAILYSISIGK